MHAKTLRCVLLLLCLTALLPAALRAKPMLPSVPPALAAPEDQKLLFVLRAKGVQIYECRAVAGEPGKYEWMFKAPEAGLFDDQDIKVGRHYAGPTWELADGGKVVGKLKTEADAPDGKGIPWLLLEAAENSAAGSLSKARWVQRVATTGGKAPEETADASRVGQERRIDYTALYAFYAARP